MEPSSEDGLGEVAQDLYVTNGTQLWSPNETIPICFAYSSGATTMPLNQRAAVTAFVKERISLTWGAVTTLKFRYRDCPTSGTESDVLVDLSWHDNGGTCFTAGKGLLTTPAQRTGDIANAFGCHISIPPAWNSSPEWLLYTQRLVLHEFGHLLGFAHEFNRDDAEGQPCGVADANDAGVELGDYDPDSIMMATYGCRNPDQYWLSAGDVANARSIYGTGDPAWATKDLVWQNTDGEVAIWRLNGTVRHTEFFLPGTVGTEFKVIGTGDFNGDGVGDLLWRRPSGGVSFWLLDRNGLLIGSNYYELSPDYQLQGIARFNSDGRSDVLWRSTSTGALNTWMMNGATLVQSVQVSFADWNWQIKLVGDFNGDGMADLFWRHRFGPPAIWLMRNGAAITQSGVIGEVDNTWTAQAVGDFNGDGKSDVFWQNRDNRTSIWFMNGTGIGSWGSPATIDSGWTAQVAGDVNADGKTDLLWRRTDGSNGVWIMDGLAIRLILPLQHAATSWSMRGALSGKISAIH